MVGETQLRSEKKKSESRGQVQGQGGRKFGLWGPGEGRTWCLSWEQGVKVRVRRGWGVRGHGGLGALG